MLLSDRRLFLLFALLGLCFVARAQEDGSAEGEASGEAEAEASGDAAAAEGEAEAEAPADGSGDAAAEGSGDAAEGEGEASGDEEEEECELEEGEAGSGSGDDVEAILALGTKKCKKSGGDEGSGDEVSGADALAAALFTCDMDGMDEKLAGCLEDMDTRVKTLEQAVLSGEGGGLEDQITLVLVKKGVIDCENSTQCADDRACIDSYEEPGRMLCELPCERTQCHVPYSECIATDHEARCECKEEFHGNGTVACIPDGFVEEENGKSYRMFDDMYVDFDNATDRCQELGARLPVLDSAETIEVMKKYLKESNFTVFEQWDQSSRRVWLGLILDRGSGLLWADGTRVISYPASSRLYVWEARRMLNQEVSYADNSRHYGFYIDGDIAKLPGGGRKGAAVLCELVPSQIREPAAQQPYDPYGAGAGYPGQGYPQQQGGGGYPRDGGYPNYPQRGGY